MTTTSRPTPGSRAPGSSSAALWRPSRSVSALVGLVAVGLAIAVAELLAALGTWLGWISTASSPLTSLGTTFIHLTPEWLKEYAIRTFGQHDKTALRVGMYVTLAVVALLVGLVARRSPRLAVGLTIVLVLVTLAAIYTTTGAVAFDALPILAGGALGMYLLIAAFRRMVDPATPTSVPAPGDVSGRGRPGPANYDRRQFFRLAGLGAAVAVVAGAVSRWVPSTAQVTASRAKAVVPVPSSKQPIPADAELEINGLTPYLTPTGSFYKVDTTYVPPNLPAEQWSLKIHGMVDKEITIDYTDLIARPQIERNITLTCVSNEVGGDLVGNATWIGARIKDLLAEAGPNGGADCVLCRSVDGFTSTAPLDALMDGRDALLAVAMNGAVLPVDHGFPVRMVVPGLYGYVSATKWVIDLKVSKFAQESAYWTQRGWSERGPIKTSSRIDVPGRTSQFPIGKEVTVAGVAWAQHRGIKSVEVQVDDGPWQPAQLAGDASIDTWRQWKFVWKATGGHHTLRCRATDGTGAVQIAAERDVLPDGATGYDSVDVVAG